MSYALVSLIAVASSFGAVNYALANDTVLALERQELSSGCAQIEFLDGYITQVDANGDSLPDYLINTQRLMCDGSQMMWCGTAGCVHRIWVQKPDGGFDKSLDTYAYEVVFDRPGDTSYKIVTREGERREWLAGAAAPASASSAAATLSGRWSYSADPLPVAAVGGPEDGKLSLTCESGELRLRYAGWWLFEGDAINTGTRQWDKSASGIVPTFTVGAHETDVPVRISEEERMLVAKDTLPLTAPLIDALARGSYVTLVHGGSLEHELQFALAGSSAALRSLRAACN
ncbi:hypothetical protein [Amorphus coralli]|uniref:hypothetical protein n=1 Tax=Amorphus coralli TaxID=340680 RepID=UPI00040CEBC0|nr:hypothetical protein [Amorphus coralli]